MKESTSKGLSRRSFVKAAGATAAVAAMGGVVAGCAGGESAKQESSSAAASSDKTPCTIGYWGGSPCELPVYVAIENGYFEEAGLDPKITLITSDVSILLANDEIDFFESTPGDFPAIYQGMPLKHLDTIHVGCWSGVTNNPDIKSCKDLAGRRVGTTMMNGPAYTECISLCAREGGDPSTIEWVKYSGSTIADALKNGEIDAACGSDATTYPIRWNNKDDVHFFYTSCEDLGEYYCCFIGCNSNNLAKYPEMGDKLTKAMAMASDYINEDPQRAIDMAMEKGYVDNAFPEIQRGLTVNYLWGHGNEKDMRASSKERWRELYDAGVLTEAPADASKVDAYLDSLVDMVVDFRGDVAKDTADTKGCAARLAELGEIYTI